MKKTTTLLAAITATLLGLAAAVQASPYSNAVLADNPVAYWQFEEATTASPAVDSGSNATITNGTYNNVNLVPNLYEGGTLGQAVQFTTPNSSNIDFGAPSAGDLAQLVAMRACCGGPELNKTTSVEFWMNSTQAGHGNNWRAPLVFGEESPGDGDIQWGWIDDNPAGTIGVAANDISVNLGHSSTSVTDGQWHHIVLTMDWGIRTQKVYVDGVLEADDVIGGGNDLLQDNEGRIRYMGWDQRSDQPATWVGMLDEVAIYDKILTDQDALDHFNAAFIPEPSSIVLLLLGLIGAASCRWRRRRVA